MNESQDKNISSKIREWGKKKATQVRQIQDSPTQKENGDGCEEQSKQPLKDDNPKGKPKPKSREKGNRFIPRAGCLLKGAILKERRDVNRKMNASNHRCERNPKANASSPGKNQREPMPGKEKAQGEREFAMRKTFRSKENASSMMTTGAERVTR